jgi:uncharacterized membrane-anchored protein
MSLPAPVLFNDTRVQAVAELHSRPFPTLTFPAQVAHLVWQYDGEGTDQSSFNVQRLSELCRHFNVIGPSPSSQFFHAQFPGFELWWERHREFVSYTLIRPGAFNHDRPFDADACVASVRLLLSLIEFFFLLLSFFLSFFLFFSSKTLA